MKPRKKIPTFKDEDAEREFWAKADSTEYIDWSQAKRIMLPNFRPTLRTISLRLPESMIAELNLLANQRGVPYQSLLRVFLAERIGEERARQSAPKKPASGKRAG
ncbi:MAG TPA: BrnA antitoxin family protein [Thermoanaerobaculia bacterium]|jgi:predicted DNA binding CopG/RHH family protein|nr:BrnA antitoxin family protein [Thermoanaerobaculia bacterium]